MALQHFLELSVLETVPVGNINRDDTGSVKTARYGGTNRIRVSSQCWKRAMREWWKANIDTDMLGIRTKYVAQEIADEIMSLTDISEEDAVSIGVLILTKVIGAKFDKKTRTRVMPDGTTDELGNAFSYLLFVPVKQIHALAEIGAAGFADGTITVSKGKAVSSDKGFAKACKDIFDVKKNAELNAIDVALFGRMIADATDMNVDATCAVSHALSVDRCELQYDFFTASDERYDLLDSGAGMMDTMQFSSGVMHRYTCVDVQSLVDSLGSADVAAEAIRVFVKAFMLSMPTGKQNSFATMALPSMCVAHMGDSVPYNTIGAFEKAIVPSSAKSITALAVDRFVGHVSRVDKAYSRDGVNLAFSACSDADNVSSFADTYKNIDDFVGAIVGALDFDE